MISPAFLSAARPRFAVGLAIAILAFTVAALARHALDEVLPPGFPFLTFFPAVIITAVFCGAAAGSLCAILCGLAAWYWFIPPVGFSLDRQSALAMGFYVFIVVVVIVLVHAMHQAMRRLDDERAHSAGLAEQQRTMFEELQHRVANNMAFVASLLNMSRRRIAQDPAAAPLVIDEARARIDTMARIHRRLHDPNSVDVAVGVYLDALCRDVLSATGATGVACKVEAPEMTLDIRTLTALSLFVTEVMTNSVKHAFPEGRGGQIAVRLMRHDDRTLELTIADDGVGLDPDGVAKPGHGLGLRIIKALAAQLHGQYGVESVGGTSTRLVFPG
jgi:two-component sensor histidine kinase